MFQVCFAFLEVQLLILLSIYPDHESNIRRLVCLWLRPCYEVAVHNLVRHDIELPGDKQKRTPGSGTLLQVQVEQ